MAARQTPSRFFFLAFILASSKLFQLSIDMQLGYQITKTFQSANDFWLSRLHLRLMIEMNGFLSVKQDKRLHIVQQLKQRNLKQKNF